MSKLGGYPKDRWDPTKKKEAWKPSVSLSLSLSLSLPSGVMLTKDRDENRRSSSRRREGSRSRPLGGWVPRQTTGGLGVVVTCFLMAGSRRGGVLAGMSQTFPVFCSPGPNAKLTQTTKKNQNSGGSCDTESSAPEEGRAGSRQSANSQPQTLPPSRRGAKVGQRLHLPDVRHVYLPSSRHLGDEG
jgi:hypothetical protein